MDSHIPPGLTHEDLLDIYSTMVLTRALDERIWMLNRQGKAAIVASCQGHEAAQLGTYWGVRSRVKNVTWFPYYRDLALMVAMGITPTELMLGFLAKEGEPLSGARQFPTHGCYPKYSMLNTSNVVGAHIPQAVGYALGYRLRKEQGVVVTHFGDGGTSTGDCHEAMNFAGIHKLPVIFVCENNKYATSVPQKKQMAIENVADRAPGYGMPGVVVDGTDLLAVYRAAAEAAERALTGGGPTFLEFKVERHLPHTSDDDDSRYRPKEEIQEARKHDPLVELQQLLTRLGILTAETDQQYRERAKREINQTTETAEKAPYPDASTFYDHVYASEGGR